MNKCPFVVVSWRELEKLLFVGDGVPRLVKIFMRFYHRKEKFFVEDNGNVFFLDNRRKLKNNGCIISLSTTNNIFEKWYTAQCEKTVWNIYRR